MPTIRVVCSERVVTRGTERVEWMIHLDGRWQRAADCAHEDPDQRTNPRSQGPQTIWERVITLAAPVGTWLQRVITTPAEARVADPLSLLSRSGRRSDIRRSYHRIDRRGVLRPVPDAGAPP